MLALPQKGPHGCKFRSVLMSRLVAGYGHSRVTVNPEVGDRCLCNFRLADNPRVIACWLESKWDYSLTLGSERTIFRIALIIGLSRGSPLTVTGP
jgi:hypothetical protein